MESTDQKEKSLGFVRGTDERSKDSLPTLENWKVPTGALAKRLKENIEVNCGWGRLIFAHTFLDANKLVASLLQEKPNQRDIAFYVRDPHVILSMAPQQFFLDPSHTFRYWLDGFKAEDLSDTPIKIRRIKKESDTDDLQRIYRSCGMIPASPQHLWETRNSNVTTYLLAENRVTGEVLGSVLGVDHVEAFEDPEKGSSLWCLAVSPHAVLPKVGKALTEGLLEFFAQKGRSFMDLSVMHDNEGAIALYEKLGWTRVPVFTVKHRNAINEPLYVPNPPQADLNPYAEIIVKEAQRRGIYVDLTDPEYGLFTLSSGGRSIRCRESLTDLTSGVAFTICDQKVLTRTILRRAGLNVPDQIKAGPTKETETFLEKYERVVVKPNQGEQGKGISVDIRSMDDLRSAIVKAEKVSTPVLIEEFVEGEDLRLVVIDYTVVAAATRKPPEVVGTGKHTVKSLIEKLSRRRASATQGESKIPLDQETIRCVGLAGHTIEDVLPMGTHLQLRKTANLHTGGTLHDVTDKLHPALRKAAEEAARAIDIPVVGFDFCVPDVEKQDYWIIEANERVGLANHEPQPTAEKFIDLLFPETNIEGNGVT